MKSDKILGLIILAILIILFAFMPELLANILSSGILKSILMNTIVKKLFKIIAIVIGISLIFFAGLDEIIDRRK